MPQQTPRRSATGVVLTLFTIIVLLSSVMAPFAALATVRTDQADYAPGSVVTISGDNSNGAGYLPGETVSVQVLGPNGYAASCEGVADANGAWSCQVTLWGSDLAVGSYSYTATGRTSGASETGTFTDAIQTETTVISSGTPSAQGQSVMFTATVKSGNPATNTVTAGQVKFGTGSNCGGDFAELQAAMTVDSSGQVTYATSTLPVGTTTIRACYLGSGSGSTALQNSFGTVTQVVNAPSDGVAPTGSVSIDSGSAYTNSTGVSLHLAATDAVGVTAYRVADGSDCSGATYVAVTATTSLDTTVPFTLSSGDGTKTVCAQFRDAALNESTVATDTIVLDTAHPTVSMSSVASDPTNTSPIQVTVTFSESVTGFTSVDVTTGNATLSNFTGSGAGYGFDLTPSGQGSVTADIAAGVAVDAADNGNAAALQFSRVYDSQPPTITITTDSDVDVGTGWYNIASSGVAGISVDISATDSSGVASLSCTDNLTPISGLSTAGGSVVLGDGVHDIACSASDNVGNSTSPSVTASFNVDQTAPSITAALDKSPAGSGWFNIVTGAPTVQFTCSDSGSSGLAGSCPADYLFGEGAAQSYSKTIYDVAGNSAWAGVSDVNVDQTAPSITAALDKSPAGSGWFNIVTGAPTVQFTCSDSGSSGLAGSCPADYLFGEGAAQSYSKTIYDVAGNSAWAGVSDVNVDLTAPDPPAFVGGGITDGASYYYGFVPAGPSATCTSADTLSGLASCIVGGGGSDVGPHSYIATAMDEAGNTSQSSLSYTVLGWTLRGFYAPVDGTNALPTVWNTVKGGSTVPLKFQIFAGTSELTDTGYVATFTAASIQCDGTGVEEPVELTTTGGTSLRYDTTAHQFVQNWKTPPKSSGPCMVVTMTTQDGSSLVAYFKLK